MKILCGTALVLCLASSLALAQGGGASGGGSAGGSASGGAAASSSSTGNSAQSASPSNGTTGSNAAAQQQRSGAGSSPTPGTAVNGPNNAGGPVPGLSTTQPSDNATVGRAPGVNPANPQDASRRGNPSDRSLPGASNPQDMQAFEQKTPQIITPAITSSAAEVAQSHSTPPIQVSGQTSNWLISKLIGTPVYNAGDEQIGTIVDLIMDPHARVTAAVVSVGQYLGTNDRNVQIPLSTLRFPPGTTGAGGSSMRLGPERAVLHVTKTTLAKLPPF